MSVVGLDFGSHAATIALWYEATDKVEVIADDLGFRTIPCAVAFRAGEGEVEVITGQAAVSQAHKNPKNTFLDVRKLLLEEGRQTVNVPALDKDISVTELASHFFRNIHNQIKQFVGRPVRETVISVPTALCIDGPLKTRLLEAATLGGVRIKSTINDCAAVLSAHKFDDIYANNGHNAAQETVAVVDLGWSRTEINIVTCSSGLFFPKATVSTDAMSGSAMVNALTTHCTKDFLRKAKLPCDDNIKAMTRLRNETEIAMKNLSTGSEAQIDIDSLCEGVDYSVKISKARFEDLGGVSLMHMNNLAASALSAAKIESTHVTQLILAGGLSGMPKCISLLQASFPAAQAKRTRGLDSAEAAAVGSALHGRNLFQLQLLDKPPSVTAQVSSPCMNSALSLVCGTAKVAAMPAGTVLPARYEMAGSCPVGGGSVQILVEANVVGTLIFTPDVGQSASATTVEVVVVVNVNVDGHIDAEVRQPNTGLVLTSLTV